VTGESTMCRQLFRVSRLESQARTLTKKDFKVRAELKSQRKWRRNILEFTSALDFASVETHQLSKTITLNGRTPKKRGSKRGWHRRIHFRSRCRSHCRGNDRRRSNRSEVSQMHRLRQTLQKCRPSKLPRREIWTRKL
jgi:hypothetical protein